MIRFSQLSFAALVLSLALAWPGQVKADGEQTAQISIRVIYAVKGEVKSIDPKLDDIKDELKDLPASKFRLLDRLEVEVALDSAVELQLPGKHSIGVKFQGIDTLDDKKKKMLSLQLTIKPALQINLRLTNAGRTLLGGPKHLEGSLILDVSAKLKEPKK
jgi:hypothetical protein